MLGKLTDYTLRDMAQCDALDHTREQAGWEGSVRAWVKNVLYAAYYMLQERDLHESEHWVQSADMYRRMVSEQLLEYVVRLRTENPPTFTVPGTVDRHSVSTVVSYLEAIRDGHDAE